MDYTPGPPAPQNDSAGQAGPYTNMQQGQVPPPPSGQPYPQYPQSPQYPQYAQYPQYGQVPPPSPVPPAAPSAGTSPKTVIIVSALAFVGITLIGLGFWLGGEPGRFMSIGIEFIPIAVLAALAYGGLKNTVARVFSYLWLLLLEVGIPFVILSNVLLAEIKDWDAFYRWEKSPGSVPLTTAFRPEAGGVLAFTLLLLMVVVIISLLMLVRPVRSLVARVIPINPANHVHAIALAFLTLTTLSSFVPLIPLGGQPPLLASVMDQSARSTGTDLSVTPQDLIYQFIWMIPATFVAAGWPIARKFGPMLKRVGLVRPTLLQVAFGVAMGIGLAVVWGFVVDPGINWLWTALGWPTTNSAAFGQLMTGVLSVPGAALIGVVAGVGEELAFRGVLQPRIGIIGANLVFTSLHALQYGPDALLSVFLTGLILGIIRWRTNTTTSAIAHGVFDFVTVVLSLV